MASKIWDFWASRYHRLWVQKYSLKPTREYVLKLIEKHYKGKEPIEVLDLGSGPGELIEEIQKGYDGFQITGIDYSEKMLSISRTRNPKVCHICMDASDLKSVDNVVDLIICTHSFPYYRDQSRVIADMSKILKDGGRIFMVFASGNSFYDKLCLFFVKFTTGTAHYPSDREFRNMIGPNLEIDGYDVIKERFFMPRIAVYTLKKVKK